MGHGTNSSSAIRKIKLHVNTAASVPEGKKVGRVPIHRMGVNLRIAAEAASLFCADTGQDKGVFVFD
jgi:tartrate dehydratase alpha subunit/fumarate hydratase class I-like protein